MRRSMLAPLERTWTGPQVRHVRPFYLSYDESVAIFRASVLGWTPARLVPFSTAAGLTTALSGIQDGDYIFYNGTGILSISSSSSHGKTFAPMSVASKAVIDFGSYYSPNHVKFSYTGATVGFYGAWIENPTNVWFVGGEFTSATSGGILWYGGSGGGFVGSVMHGCGASAWFCTPSASFTTVNGCTFVWEAFGNNQNPSADPHGDSGGGYHEGLLGDGNVANSLVENCIFACYGHDSQLGSAVQFGDSGTNIGLNNNTFYVWAANNTYVATVSPWDIAMGFVAWGSGNLSGNVVNLLQVQNYSGRATFCDSLTSTSANGVTVVHARAINTNQNTGFLASHDGTLSSSAAFDTRQPSKFIHLADCVQR